MKTPNKPSVAWYGVAFLLGALLHGELITPARAHSPDTREVVSAIRDLTRAVSACKK